MKRTPKKHCVKAHSPKAHSPKAHSPKAHSPKRCSCAKNRSPKRCSKPRSPKKHCCCPCIHKVRPVVEHEELAEYVEPVCHEPVCHEPVCHEPVCHEPVCHEPVCHEPVCHEPVCHEPVWQSEPVGECEIANRLENHIEMAEFAAENPVEYAIEHTEPQSCTPITLSLSDYGIVFTNAGSPHVYFSPDESCKDACEIIPDTVVTEDGCMDFIHGTHGQSVCLRSFMAWLEPLLLKVFGLATAQRSIGVVRLNSDTRNSGIAFFDLGGKVLISSDSINGETLAPATVMLGVEAPIGQYIPEGVNYGYTNPELFSRFDPVPQCFMDFLCKNTHSDKIGTLKNSKYFATYRENCDEPVVLAFDSYFKDVKFTERYNSDENEDVSGITVVSAYESVRATKIYERFLKMTPPAHNY